MAQKKFKKTAQYRVGVPTKRKLQAPSTEGSAPVFNSQKPVISQPGSWFLSEGYATPEEFLATSPKGFGEKDIVYFYEQAEEGDWEYFAEGMIPKAAKALSDPEPEVKPKVETFQPTAFEPDLNVELEAAKRRAELLEQENRELRQTIAAKAAELEHSQSALRDTEQELIEKDAQLTLAEAQSNKASEWLKTTNDLEKQMLQQKHDFEMKLRARELQEETDRKIKESREQGLNDFVDKLKPFQEHISTGLGLVLGILTEKMEERKAAKTAPVQHIQPVDDQAQPVDPGTYQEQHQPQHPAPVKRVKQGEYY